MLQRLANVQSESLEDWPDGRYSRYAAWDGKLELFVSRKVGQDAFGSVSAEFASHYDIEPDMCLKFPASASGMLQKFRSSGVDFSELDDILEAVDNLVRG